MPNHQVYAFFAVVRDHQPGVLRAEDYRHPELSAEVQAVQLAHCVRGLCAVCDRDVHHRLDVSHSITTPYPNPQYRNCMYAALHARTLALVVAHRTCSTARPTPLTTKSSSFHHQKLYKVRCGLDYAVPALLLL